MARKQRTRRAQDTPAIAALRQRAYALCRVMAEQGQPVPLEACYHALARQAGYADWRSCVHALRSPAPDAPAPAPAPPAPRPQARRPAPDEVLTEFPEHVRDVADMVEAFVRGRGPCVKSDVSAALPPDVGKHLAAAYKHLHLSRRVEIRGVSLRPWPKPPEDHAPTPDPLP